MSLFKHMTDKATTVAGKVQKGLAAAGMALAGALVSAKATYYGLTLQYASAATFAHGAGAESTGISTMDKIVNLMLKGMEGVGLILIITGVVNIATAIKSGEQNRATRIMHIGYMFCN